ncbi:hypothetical protein SKAU_G00178610 [Synaphobranchus kaupii]|uniref:Uncharacterized protein n=1 Tax=Synaphobranchus kaupii TaxID=118154 RepID=A0A9Q1J0I3_SYNKA|nr:hypothetical protein SKAU_G00178610 [Synaphobranchus kaupii]
MSTDGLGPVCHPFMRIQGPGDGDICVRELPVSCPSSSSSREGGMKDSWVGAEPAQRWKATEITEESAHGPLQERIPQRRRSWAHERERKSISLKDDRSPAATGREPPPPFPSHFGSCFFPPPQVAMSDALLPLPGALPRVPP